MTSAVYLLLKAGTVVYVGQSVNVEKRLTEHRGKKDFDEHQIIPTSVTDLKRVEQEYILKYRPPLNGRKHRYGWQAFFDSSGQAKAPSERQADHRKRMRAAGFRQYEVWAHVDDGPTLKRIVRWVQYKASKDPNYQPYLK